MAKEKQKKEFKLSFQLLLMILGLAPLIIGVIIATAISVSTLEAEVEEETFNKLEVAAQDLASYYEWDIVNAGEATYEHDYVDSLKDNGIELTVFKDDVRYMTSLLKDGSTERNEGSTADPKIYETVKSGKEYHAEGVKIGGKDYYVYYEPLYAADGSVWGMAFAGTEEAAVVKAVNGVVMKLVVTSVIVVLIFVALIVFLAMKLKAPMIKSAQALMVLAGGDISAAIDAKSPIKEVDEMVNAAVSLQANLQKTIGGVKSTAGDLNGAAHVVDGLSETSSDGASQISNAVSELATTAQSMAESVQDVNTQVIEMGNQINDIAESVSNLSQASASIREANSEASKYMDIVMKSAADSVETSKEVSAQIDATNKAISKINDAVDIILGISDQTKLLSLNATIEAARAGEAGRGFAVVAESISQLAEQSTEGANQIKEIADEIVEMSGETVKKAEEISAIILKEQKYIADTQSKFDTLSRGVDDSIVEIQAISDRTETLNAVKDGITANVSDLSAISEENAASNQEVTASIESIAMAISDTRDKSGEMSNMSDVLAELVAYFK